MDVEQVSSALAFLSMHPERGTAEVENHSEGKMHISRTSEATQQLHACTQSMYIFRNERRPVHEFASTLPVWMLDVMCI